MDHGNKSIGLSLSGGGFRAAFFHMGVLRYLSEAGQLANVGGISSVSGGSIAAAMLATKWNVLEDADFTQQAFMDHVYEPFFQPVTTGNFRNRFLLMAVPTSILLLYPKFTYFKLWTWLFDRWFYGDEKITIDKLPKSLDLVINATSLKKAKMYRFAPSYRGDNDGYIEDDPYRTPVELASAVTASSAHLPLYIPMGDDDGHWFVDGGAFDNTALDWFLDWKDKSSRPSKAHKPTFLLASDASPELGDWSSSWWRNLPVLRMFPVASRVWSIVQEQTRRTRKDWFIDRIRHDLPEECRKNNGIIISIDLVANELKELDKNGSNGLATIGLPRSVVERVRMIRTDMNHFTRDEADILAYHGYSLTHIYLKTFQSDTKIGGRLPYIEDDLWDFDLSPGSSEKYLHQLKASDKHFAYGRKFY